jgi:trehalose 6-phosphate synthase
MIASAFYQLQSSHRQLERQLGLDGRVVTETLEKAIQFLAPTPSEKQLTDLVDSFQKGEELEGVAIYDASGRILAGTLSQRSYAKAFGAATRSLNGSAVGEFVQFQDKRMYVFARPMVRDSSITGAIAIALEVSALQSQARFVWYRELGMAAALVLLIALANWAIVRRAHDRPLRALTQWLVDVRTGKPSGAPELLEERAFKSLKREVGRLAATLSETRAAVDEEARLRIAGESFWTPERLRVFIQTKLGGKRLFAISNREPYEHVRRDGTVTVTTPASGLVTALEPILRACNGTWIAQGMGNADRDTVDQHDRLLVPPDEPQYTLRRVWATAEENRGFYSGFANEGLWPLCHIAHARPVFRSKDWEQYRLVNQRFADALVTEIAGEKDPIVLVQDYHFALLPSIVKKARPDAKLAIFWHIPWPNPEAFGICPWHRELLDGLLGADLVGFHLQSHCNNFLDTVDRMLECRIDRERFAVNRHGHFTEVRPFPISVSWAKEGMAANSWSPSLDERAAVLRGLGTHAPFLGVGVDRIDYTKGIPERLYALETFFEKYPTYQGQFTFVQIGAPSRIGIRRYDELMNEVKIAVARINARFQKNNWQPIIFRPQHHSHSQILPYYRAADVCLVTSLHDGMNLVAKEYVASRSDEQGALVLSRFAGASNELIDALLVNPYDAHEVADAIHRALCLPPEEKQARMARMRAQVREHNIYRWAGNLISTLAAVRLDTPAESLADANYAPNDFRSEAAISA